MDAYKDVFNVTGPARAADLIYRHPDDPIGALKADLAAFRKERAAQVIPEPTPPKRKGSGMAHISGVSSEWREHMAAQARLEDDHFAGRHHEPVAACPKCGTVAA